MRKKILVVFGTRPEAIKLAPLIKEFENYRDEFDVKVCVTAQHREMLDQVLTLFDIVPDYDLDIMKPNQDLFDITAKILLNLKVVLEDFKPNLVLVHGDTTTTFTASLSAFYKGISVGHIEAGLRTGDIRSPYPEEANRVLTTKITDFHFAPTLINKDNLLQDGINQKDIIVTGNSVIDALFWILNRIKLTNSENRLKQYIEKKGYRIRNRKIILVTGHRRENFGKSFLEICEALKEIAINNRDIDIVYPVHLNPNVRKPVNAILSNIKNVCLLEPLDYEPFIFLMDRCYLILTDSGGIQEEAPSLGKPVLVMRNSTERPEAINAGTVKLVGTNKNIIIEETETLLNKEKYIEISKAHNPYGDGKSSKRIVEFLKERL